MKGDIHAAIQRLRTSSALSRTIHFLCVYDFASCHIYLARGKKRK